MRLRAVIATAAVVFTASAAHAAPPVNDDLVDATPAALGIEIEVTNDDATVEPGEPLEPSCVAGRATTGRTVWFTIAATTTEDLILDPLSQDVVPVVALYTGATYETLTEVGCGDAAMRAPVTAGTTYLLQVGGYNGDGGRLVFSLSTDAPIPPPDESVLADDLADAGFASPPYRTQAPGLAGATIEPGEEALCDRGEFSQPTGSLWLLVRSPIDGAITIEADGFAVTNVYRGRDISSLQPVRCESWDDAYDWLPPRIHVVANEVYAVQVFADGEASNHPFLVTLDGPFPVPANDTVAAATDLVTLPFSDEVDLRGATNDATEPVSFCVGAEEAAWDPARLGHRRPTSRVWYRYTTDRPTMVDIDDFQSDWGSEIDVFSIEDDGKATTVACGLELPLVSTGSRTFTAFPGDRYLIGIGAEEYRSSYDVSEYVGILRVTFSERPV